MRVGIVGAGNIGGNAARLLARAGHRVGVGFSRNPDALAALADEIGGDAGTAAQVVEDAEVVLLSVPWAVVDDALAAAGGPPALAGKIVIDTTNQFGRVDGRLAVLDLGGESAARHNAAKAPGARWAKAFNTLTAGFQASAAGRDGPDRVVMFYGTDSEDAAPTIELLINDAGFDPVRTGTLDRTEVGHQEPKGDLYGEEFHHADAVALVARLRGTLPSGRGPAVTARARRRGQTDRRSVRGQTDGRSIRKDTDGRSVRKRTDGRSARRQADRRSMRGQADDWSIPEQTDGRSILEQADARLTTDCRSILKQTDRRSVPKRADRLSTSKQIDRRSASKQTDRRSVCYGRER